MVQPSVILCVGLSMLLLPGVMCEECPSCGDNAECTDGVCSCPDGLIGNPRVHCYTNWTKICTLTSDPLMLTFSAEKIHVTIVGATRLADLTVTRLIKSLSQKCKLVVWALTERIRGKLFIDGMKIKFTRVEDSGESAVTELLVKSSVEDGIVSWDFTIQETSNANFQSCCRFDEAIGSGSCSVDYGVGANNFYIFNFSCCNISVGIRPPIPGSNSTPAIWVDVPSPNVTYEDWEPGLEPICLSHDSYDIDSVVNETQLGDPWDAMSYLSLTNIGDLEYDGVPNNFTQLAQALRGCNKLATLAFYDDAVFALDTPPFINCISTSTTDQDGLVEFLLLVLDWFCVGDSISCAAAKGLVSTKCQGVANQNPRVQAFLGRSCSRNFDT
ncbi:unnamed protein product [Lymnaea stagnalis]|uniref:Uncharacterized protein n=1 Tax=Lymnaea stagnalis TaxID=6523 RepID=A0AAV2HT61_LYMST